MRRLSAKLGLIGQLMLPLAIVAPAMPVAAQSFSDSFQFLKAVRDRKAEELMKYIDRPSIIDTRDQSTGEAGLHILVKRRDTEWLNYFLGKRAKVDIRDNDGNTPLALAALVGYADGARLLLESGAGVNIANDRGETPLILAVQKRDLETVRLLVSVGANPLQQDRVAGMSARDYAAQDRRSTQVLKILDEAKAVAPKAQVAGPRL